LPVIITKNLVEIITVLDLALISAKDVSTTASVIREHDRLRFRHFEVARSVKDGFVKGDVVGRPVALFKSFGLIRVFDVARDLFKDGEATRGNFGKGNKTFEIEDDPLVVVGSRLVLFVSFSPGVTRVCHTICHHGSLPREENVWVVSDNFVKGVVKDRVGSFNDDQFGGSDVEIIEGFEETRIRRERNHLRTSGGVGQGEIIVFADTKHGLEHEPAGVTNPKIR